MIKKLLPLTIVLLTTSAVFSQSYVSFTSEVDDSRIVVNSIDTFDMPENKARVRVTKGVNFLENIKSGYLSKTKTILTSRVGGTIYSFDSLVKIPELTDEQTRITLNRMKTDSILSNFKVSLFEDYEDYRSDKNTLTFDGVADYLGLNWKRIEYDLVNFLDTEGMSNDSNEDGLSIAKNTARLNIDVLGIKLTRVRAVLCDFTMEVKFTLLDLNYKEITSSLVVTAPRQTNDESFSKHVAHSIKEGLCQFIQRLQETGLLEPVEDDVADFAGLSEIAVPTKPYVHFADARKAVVTVITERGHGSGCRVSQDGLIMTNFHVIAESDTIRVVTFNSDTIPVQVVFTDPNLDIAVLNSGITTQDYFEIKPNQLSIGDPLFAIGTPVDLKLSHSVSKGILSANIDLNGIDYIQTDAEINGGNSGGALVDRTGQLVGIVNAKAVGIFIEGIGFAISTKSILERINISYK